MSEIVVEYKDDNYNVVLTVRQATVRDGLKRSIMISTGYDALSGKKEEEEKQSPEERLYRIAMIHTYPICLSVADVVNKKGAKKKIVLDSLSKEDFLTLPDALVLEWERAAIKLNPHWIPQMSKEKDDEGGKQEPNSD